MISLQATPVAFQAKVERRKSLLNENKVVRSKITALPDSSELDDKLFITAILEKMNAIPYTIKVISKFKKWTLTLNDQQIVLEIFRDDQSNKVVKVSKQINKVGNLATFEDHTFTEKDYPKTRNLVSRLYDKCKRITWT